MIHSRFVVLEEHRTSSSECHRLVVQSHNSACVRIPTVSPAQGALLFTPTFPTIPPIHTCLTSNNRTAAPAEDCWWLDRTSMADTTFKRILHQWNETNGSVHFSSDIQNFIDIGFIGRYVQFQAGHIFTAGIITVISLSSFPFLLTAYSLRAPAFQNFSPVMSESLTSLVSLSLTTPQHEGILSD